MHVGWTRIDMDNMGVISGLDAGGGPRDVHGNLMDVDEVQLAGDGELFIKSPYQIWKPEDTRVIVYVLYRPEADRDDPPHLRQGWRLAKTAAEARAVVRKEFGDILEENAAGDNVFFRVRRRK